MNGTLRVLLLVVLATLLACTPSRKSRRRSAAPRSGVSAPAAGSPSLALSVSHIVNRSRAPRHRSFLFGHVNQDERCRGLGARPFAALDGLPIQITPGEYQQKDELFAFPPKYQCVEPYLSAEFDGTRVQRGRLEIRGQGVNIVAESPYFSARPLVEEGGPTGARPGQGFTLRWLVPGMVPNPLRVWLRGGSGEDTQLEARLVGDQLQVTLPRHTSFGQGTLEVAGDFESPFTHCEGIPRCTAKVSFSDLRPFTVVR